MKTERIVHRSFLEHTLVKIIKLENKTGAALSRSLNKIMYILVSSVETYLFNRVTFSKSPG